MNGIPVTVWDEGPKTLVLGHRQSGDAGARMRKLKGDFHTCQRQAASAFRDVAKAARAAEKTETEADLERLAAAQDAAAGIAHANLAAALDHARELARLALEMNYPGQAERMLDLFTDAQLREVPGILETGDVPQDFFRSRDTPPSGTSTSPDNGTSGESCLSTDLVDG